jgi:hypothetical protein
MSEPLTSVVLAGRGLLRWPGGEERVHYRVTIRLDNGDRFVGMPKQRANVGTRLTWPKSGRLSVGRHR